MEKYIPYEKLAKKEKRKMDRVFCNGIRNCLLHRMRFSAILVLQA